MIKQMSLRRTYLPAAFLCLLTAELTAIPYTWSSKAGEASFSLDVPDGWRTWESVKRNGAIVQFRRGHARIEIRSMAAKDGFSVKQILNQKSARLSGEYAVVKYLGERPPNHASELQFSSWEISAKGTTYIDETAVVLSPEGPVVVSCMVRADEKEKFRTHCENAFYSLSLTGEGETKQVKADVTKQLQKIYFVHIPGNLPVVSPESLMLPQPAQTKPTPSIQYDENYILPDDKNR